MGGYDDVARALREGREPEMLCVTCPWNRPCITPPEMTSAEVDAEIRVGQAADKAAAETSGQRGVPTGLIIQTAIYAGRDTACQVCPVLALRIRTAGEPIVKGLRAMMRIWEEAGAGGD